MADTPKRERRFNDQEVALIIKRAAELQQTEQSDQDTGNALSLTEVEEIAHEAGMEAAAQPPRRRPVMTLTCPSSSRKA